jgi:hypothetical protein
MSTTRSFSEMLNQYLPYELLTEELLKRDWLLSNCEMDNGWKDSTLIVPFKGAGASSIAFGSLTDTADVSEDAYVRGSISAPKELWGTMVFNHRDLMDHDGQVPEKTFLRILPDAVDAFTDFVKQALSTALLNGPHFAKLLSDGTSGGSMTVDHPERFQLKQKVYVDDDNSAPSSAGYVQTIDINTKTITLDTTRAGGSDLDISSYTVDQNAKVYMDGAQTAANQFSSLRGALLSAANGGDSTLYGTTKTAYPYLQAVNVDGSGVTAVNLLDKIFDGYVTVRTLGKGNANKVVMSYKNLATALKQLESSKGAFNVVPGSNKASIFGWTEIQIGGVKGALTVVGVQEMDDDVIMYLDMSAFKFFSNGFFRKRIAPDGKHYYEVRATTGYSYYVDICCFGDLVVHAPNRCGILYGISY